MIISEIFYSYDNYFVMLDKVYIFIHVRGIVTLKETLEAVSKQIIRYRCDLFS